MLTYSTNKAFDCSPPLSSLLSPPRRPFCVVGRLGRKKKKARGAQWEREREKRGLFLPFPSSLVPCALFIFLLLLFWGGYPVGASAEERGWGITGRLIWQQSYPIPGSEIVGSAGIEKAGTWKYNGRKRGRGRAARPAPLCVPFTFASSSLSESLEQATPERQRRLRTGKRAETTERDFRC